MYIHRTLEKYILDFLLSTKKIQIIYGARQTGKSTLAQQIINQSKLKTLSINGENPRQVQILTSKSTEQYKLYFSDYQLLFIDEAQYIPQIGEILKLIYDHLDLKILVTGSSSFHIAEHTSEPLTGRKLTYTLYPFSLSEIKQIYSPLQISENLENILIYGLYPEIFLTKNIALKQKLLLELTDAYLFKDIFTLFYIKKPDKIRRLVQMLAFQTGQLVSVAELASSLQLSSETVLRYIELLEKAHIIFRLLPYGKNLRKQMKKKFKVYFNDIGIRNAIIEDFRPFDLRQDRGNLWENFIIAEIIKLSSNRLRNDRFYFWRNYSGAEVDLVQVSTNGKITAYEIKLTQSRKSPPRSWTETEPNAHFSVINQSNFLSVLQAI